MFEIIALAIGSITPFSIMMTFVGTFMGLVFGSLPGLTASMGIALLIPLTYKFDSAAAFGMMIGCYIGGISGGAVSSILLNIPGTPSSIVTTFDGHPMAKKGKAAEALGWAAISSGVGGMFSWVILVFLAPSLAKWCTSFSMSEYAALAFLGLTIIASMSGKNIVKGVIAGCFGLFLSMIGVDPVWGDLRFTFGSSNLMSGVNLMPALIGLYSIPQIIDLCQQPGGTEKVNVKATMKDFIPKAKDMIRSIPTFVLSSVIGTIIGIIPATGSSTAAFFAYDQARRISKDPDSFGKGNHNGIIASETSNNAVCGGALIPMLTLGIPGDAVTAIMMGGLLIHGLEPGPALFAEHYDFIVAIFTLMFLSTIMMVVIQLFGIKFFIKILAIPPYFLTCVLIILALLGSYALRGSMFDIWVALVLGVVGFFMQKAGFPVSPCVLGLVLGSMFERELRLALKASNGDISIFFTRPISCVIILAAFAFVIHSIISNIRQNRKEATA